MNARPVLMIALLGVAALVGCRGSPDHHEAEPPAGRCIIDATPQSKDDLLFVLASSSTAGECFFLLDCRNYNVPFDWLEYIGADRKFATLEQTALALRESHSGRRVEAGDEGVAEVLHNRTVRPLSDAEIRQLRNLVGQLP